MYKLSRHVKKCSPSPLSYSYRDS